MKTYTKDNLPRKLVIFLIKHKALDQYLHNMNTLERFSCVYSPDNDKAISAAFSWAESEQKFEFWIKIHDEWNLAFNRFAVKINEYLMDRDNGLYRFGCQVTSFSEVKKIGELLRAGNTFELKSSPHKGRTNTIRHIAGSKYIGFNANIVSIDDVNKMLRFLHLKQIPR